MNWFGVMPAMTTAFDEHLQVDHAFMQRHAQWLLDHGCTGLVMLGSLGEAATLAFEEKVAVLKNMVASANGKAPIVAAISALSTTEAVSLAKAAEDAGCSGLMVLPPYVYRGDWREMKAHLAAVFRATPLSCMLYNNPVAYGTDFLPEHIAELAEAHKNFHSVKESSTDVRRVTAIRALVGDRLKIFVGVDDAIVEGIAAGACGWIAGLVNALPAESVALFHLAYEGKTKEAFELYRWFLPLLRMDTLPKFIQLIKLVQQELGVGNARVRPPRLEITGEELVETKKVIAEAMKHRPKIKEAAFASVAMR
ncbi:dihydrodipicolinate synthase family protein [Pseudacidobacterium ailaaui]|jgi:4-hydroxy-tetrahydrodipicolinate synthase|uniref:dihydrodipicolinate synthase family protein n=1 Tax=Pseudacidobacterium ailaaui TaxID=1382359 RepID=UPI0005D2843E|nr:dihydrodipicolinate synthase family protein [Pseudacidobacterium ailaaui]